MCVVHDTATETCGCPTIGPESASPEVAVLDPGFQHWLRWLGVYGALVVACLFVVGFVWIGWILHRTGYRKRDTLLMVVPVANAATLWRCLWRYTARSVYWSPRAERESQTLQSPQRPFIIGAGALLFPVLALVAVAALSESSEWDDPEYEQSFIEGLNEVGYDNLEARCIVGYLKETFPDGPPEEDDDPAWVLNVRRSVDTCVPEAR